jgi:diguanylate cyclase (GGDEF)-like protein
LEIHKLIVQNGSATARDLDSLFLSLKDSTVRFSDSMLNPALSSLSNDSPQFQESDQLLGGRFEITRVIGVEGNAQICLAEDLHQKKGLLRLRIWSQPLEDMPYRWQEDLSFCAARLDTRRDIRHSNLGPVPSLLWLEENDSVTALCSAPQMDGVTLYKACARAPWNAVSELLVHVLRGLERLHSHDIYQGALNPRDLYVQGGGQRKLARLADPGLEDLRELHQLFGDQVNPWALAPEVVAGRDHDRRSDLYSFGLMFYELCCRHHPFEKKSDRHVVAPRELKGTLPKSFEQTILKLLSEQAEDRYPTANSVIRELSSASKKRYTVEPKQSRLSTVYPVNWTGHEETLGAVVDRVQRVQERDGDKDSPFILLSAPAGAGKSSVLRALREACQREDRNWLRGRFREGSREGILKLVSHALDLTRDLDNGEPIRRRHGAVLARAFPEFDLSFSPAPELGQDDEKNRLISAIVGLLLGLATHAKGLVLEIEDAELADPLSLGVMIALSRVLSNPDSGRSKDSGVRPSLCVIVSVNVDDMYGRPSEAVFEEELGDVKRVTLGELSQSDALRLVSGLLGREISQSGKLYESLRPKINGSPFTLIQCVHDLVDRRFLRAPGQDLHKENISGDELPYGNVQELLDIRLNGLDNADRQMLSLVALAGSLTPPRIADVLEMSHSEGSWRSRRLIRKAFLSRCPFDGELRIISSLFEESLLGSLSAKQRESFSETLGQSILQSRSQCDRTEKVEKAQRLDRATYLLLRSQTSDPVSQLIREVAQGNARIFNNKRALELWNVEIRSLLDRLAQDEGLVDIKAIIPDDALTWTALPTEALELRRLLQTAWFERGDTALALGRPKEARVDFERSLKGARALRQPRDVILTLTALGDLEWRLQNFSRAQSQLEEGLTLAQEISWLEGLAQVSFLLARVFEAQNRFSLGLEVLGRLEESTQKRPQATLQLLKGRLLLAQGHNLEGRERVEEALETLDEGSQSVSLVEALCLLSQLEQNDGVARKALHYGTRALAIAKTQYSDAIIATALSRVASVLAFQGQVTEALAYFEEALRRAEYGQDARRRRSIYHEQGTLLRRLGHFQEAARVFENSVNESSTDVDGSLQASIELARCHLLTGKVGLARKTLEAARADGASAGVELESHCLRAEIALQVGDLTKGIEFAKRSVEGAVRLGDRVAETNGRLVHGQLLLALGRLDEAYSEFREAKQLATSILLWSSQAEAQLGLGQYHVLVGQPGPALSAFEAGRDAAQLAGDRVIEVRSLRALGRFHHFLGQSKRALAHLDMALTQSNEAGLALETSDIRLTLIELQLGDTANPESKLQSFSTELSELEKESRQNSRRGLRARIELIRSRLLLAQGDVKAARQRARAAVEAARIGRYGLLEIESELLLAQLHGRVEKWESAAKQAKKTHGEALRLQMAESQAHALAILGEAQLARGDVLGAARAIREAASRVRALWASLPEDLRTNFLGKPEFRRIASLAEQIIQEAGRGTVEPPSEVPEGTDESEPAKKAGNEPLRDSLTGLFNHSYFLSQLDVEIKRARRHSRSVVLLKATIDRFKLVRELYGNKVSKAVIKSVAEIIIRNLRDVDLVARYFGDQFEILLPDTGTSGGLLTAERVRDAVEQLSVEHDGERIDVTLSLGMAVFPDDADECDELVRRCDEALYNARSVGPNHIYSFVKQDPSESKVTDANLRDLDALLLSREGRVIVSMVNRIVNTNLAFDELTKLVTSMVVDATRGQRGFFMIVNENNELEFRYGRNMDNEVVNVAEGEISLGIAKEVARRGEAMLIEEALDDDRFRSFKSVLDLRLRSILCAPIKLGDEVLGVVYVDHNSISRHFNNEDLNFLRAIAERIAVPLANSKRLDDAERKLREAQVQLQASQNALQTKYRYENIIGRSKPMVSVLKLIDRVVDTHHSIVIHGESGTGKELVARAIHYNGPRKGRPFIAENCAALSDTLLEAELFGHVKGAFTGADRDSKGFFELANGGTLFLDEIGDMSEPMQKKLLRVLQEGEIRPVGGKKVVHVDVRILSASNKDLKQLVASGLFREDLYYRLNVIKVDLPPLRERKEDIPLLVDHFLTKIEGCKNHEVNIARDVLRVLTEYDWPGNIRELENEINKLLAMTDGKIGVEDLSPKFMEQAKTVESPSLDRLARYYNRPLKDVETEMMRDIIIYTLERTNWHRTKAAKILGIPTSTLFNKMKKYGIG